ncbi:MAG TPA: histidine kinase dimerization/phospho-acceptor domain-containing protein, partial [Planctomycetota bacterium]|nr:histidine kinase dimerization/phospho-acceptor domain-containing protein [Planctomycetota bacterium]
MNAKWWWLGYALAVAVVVGAMAWFTALVANSQAAELRAQRSAFVDETARLALWRMDSQLATIVAREAGRPHITYNAFYPVTGALDRAYDNLKAGEVIVPSPLLGLDQQEVLLHVQIASDGVVSSPQVPSEQLRTAAVPNLCSAEQVTRYGNRLRDFSQRVTYQRLDQALADCPGGPLGSRGPDVAFICALPTSFTNRNSKESAMRSNSALSQAAKSSNDVNRQQDIQGVDYAQAFNEAARINGQQFTELPAQQKVEADIMRPLWFSTTDGQNLLLLGRRVQAGTRRWLQACWLDWPSLRQQLLASIQDLLPEADLIPSRGVNNSPHRLATLPLDLRPGTAVPDWQEPVVVTASLPLVGAWTGVILALVAGGVLLGGALALSERRGAFVSAVTHELRTPLTTFRLYTDLLAEGHVVDEAERQRCLGTLRSEAERLGHLVENVLGYARLERASL